MADVREKYADKKVLAVSPRVINQISAEKMAKEEIISTGARLPPANVRYHIIWFRKKLQYHPIRTYTIIDYPAPAEIEGRHIWNAADLEDSFNCARGKYLKHSFDYSIKIV